MTDIEKAIQEFEDHAYHYSMKPTISESAVAVALACMLKAREFDTAIDKTVELENKISELQAQLTIYRGFSGCKLQQLIDAELDGQLVVLPCKPKDIVYFIGCDYSKCSAYGEEYDEASCQGCEVVCDSKKTYSVYTTRAEDLRWILQRYFDFGKTYFATSEAAQAALELRVK